MKRLLYSILLLFLLPTYAFAQEAAVSPYLDMKYREDQFYAGFSYSMLGQLPSDMRLRGLSGALQVGFLRDMPLNKSRSIAIAAGVGLSFNRYGQNLFIGRDTDGELIYRILGKEGPVKYKSNRLGTYILEVPIQIRWRGSTADKYQFWRIYGGLTLGYVYWSRSTFVQPGNKVRITNISDLEKLRWSANISFGYNKINFFAKYDLNNLFQKDIYTTDGSLLEVRPLQFGFIFYIL